MNKNLSEITTPTTPNSYFQMTSSKSRKSKDGNYQQVNSTLTCEKGDINCEITVNNNGNIKKKTIKKQNIMNNIGQILENRQNKRNERNNLIDFNQIIPSIPVRQLANKSSNISNHSPYNLSNLPEGVKVLEVNPSDLRKMIKNNQLGDLLKADQNTKDASQLNQEIIAASDMELEELPVIKDKVSNMDKDSQSSIDKDKDSQSNIDEKSTSELQGGRSNLWKWF